MPPYLQERLGVWAFGTYDGEDVAVLGYEYEAYFYYFLVFNLDWDRSSGEFSMSMMDYGYYGYEDVGVDTGYSLGDSGYSWDTGYSPSPYSTFWEASGTARP